VNVNLQRRQIVRIAVTICSVALGALVAAAQAPVRLSALPDAPSPILVTVPLSHAASSVAASQASPAPAQEAPQTPAQPPDSILTMFPHSQTAPYWISGQANVIMQAHEKFSAQYSGRNSLTNWAQSSTTHVLTLYTGYALTHTTEVFADLEDATGSGIGNANGLAGYTNMDSVRLANGVALSKGPYIARFMLRQIIPLTQERQEADRDYLHLATSLPARRLEFRVGKMDVVDFFDLNTWGSDSHLQFANWTVDSNGAYDYAADTRGYTDAALLEYDDHWWTVRFAEAMMPKTANGRFLDADIARARSENLELEARGKRIANRAGTVRLLSYLNHANMGNYEEAIADYLHGEGATPDIIATRRQGRHKYGFGLNFEQEITPRVGVFGRLGWSDGRNESFAYTEDDRTVELGAFLPGTSWHRNNDRAGTAFVANGIVPAHQNYLALGGLGFILGDGALTYGHEKIVESFYTAHLWRGLFASYDFQHINDPGYNQARGPVSVHTLRAHIDF
jgi:carbohydrate-selective porin OprB